MKLSFPFAFAFALASIADANTITQLGNCYNNWTTADSSTCTDGSGNSVTATLIGNTGATITVNITAGASDVSYTALADNYVTITISDPLYTGQAGRWFGVVDIFNSYYPYQLGYIYQYVPIIFGQPFTWDYISTGAWVLTVPAGTTESFQQTVTLDTLYPPVTLTYGPGGVIDSAATIDLQRTASVAPEPPAAITIGTFLVIIGIVAARRSGTR